MSDRSKSVIPAKAGIQAFAASSTAWIPAFAGMTVLPAVQTFPSRGMGRMETSGGPNPPDETARIEHDYFVTGTLGMPLAP